MTIKKTMKHKSLCICEWQSFGVKEIKGIISYHNSINAESDNDKGESKLTQKAQKIFAELVEFAHQEGKHCLLKFKNSSTLVAQNYVGLIQTKSGFCVEILPKTFYTAKEYQGFETQQDESVRSAKEILLRMLQTLKNSPFKSSHFAHLKTQDMPLLEIFISMFLDELDNLVKKGLRSHYIMQEENRRFLKGKLLFSQNIKHNFTHQERFFMASDEFSTDIAPNRLIKSTLEVLSKQNLSSKISAKFTQLRFVFADITPSQNIDKDLSRCANSRLFSAYELVLQWCKIFLKRQTFTSYRGSNKAFALLFDMNKLFESFVASEMKKWFINEDFRNNNAYYKDFMKAFEEFQSDSIETQEKSKFLVQKDKQNRFCLKPDIVGYEKADKDSKPIFIADTKWKILSNDSNKNYGISLSDMYQIFAYLTKYECKQGFLIYPEITKNNKELKLPLNPNSQIKELAFTFKTDFQTKLIICFFPLFTNSKHKE